MKMIFTSPGSEQGYILRCRCIESRTGMRQTCIQITFNTKYYVGRDSSVGIATCYEMDGPGIESRWGEIFSTRPDRPWDLSSLLYNGYRVSFPGVKRPGRGVDHPPPSIAEVKERVELYLYSPSGP
jgi:hypothetical protein